MLLTLIDHSYCIIWDEESGMNLIINYNDTKELQWFRRASCRWSLEGEEEVANSHESSWITEAEKESWHYRPWRSI